MIKNFYYNTSGKKPFIVKQYLTNIKEDQKHFKNNN